MIDVGAVPPPHQDAILSIAQVGEAVRQPDSDQRQHDRESGCGQVVQHPVAVFRRGFLAVRIAGEAVRAGPDRRSSRRHR